MKKDPVLNLKFKDKKEEIKYIDVPIIGEIRDEKIIWYYKEKDGKSSKIQ